MPFEETHVVDERTRFIEDVHRSLKSFTAICERYGISRTTGYKWLARWKAHGPPGLEDRPSRPKHCPWATTPEVVEAILDLRRTYDDYGAKKIRWFLQRHRPELDLPSRTTIHNILCRHDLVPKRRRRVRRWHPGRPDTSADTPNESWSADFKGEFPTRDGHLCYPLTVQDMHSRFLLACHGRPDVTIDGVIPVFTRLFRKFGLPDRIRTDNGTPFASNATLSAHGEAKRSILNIASSEYVPILREDGCSHREVKSTEVHTLHFFDGACPGVERASHFLSRYASVIRTRFPVHPANTSWRYRSISERPWKAVEEVRSATPQKPSGSYRRRCRRTLYPRQSMREQ